MYPLLVDDETLYEVGIVDDSSCLLLDLDVACVNGFSFLDIPCCFDDDIGEVFTLSADGFACHGGLCDLPQELVVIRGDSDTVEDLDCLLCCEFETVGDDCGVDVRIDE